MAKRVLLGKKGSEYGLYISKPGVDVTTTTSAKDLLFNSGATTTVTGSSPTTSEKSFRSGVIVTDTTITTVNEGATQNLPSTLGSDNNYYIPAYQIVENGIANPTSGFDESHNPSGFALYEIESSHISGLPTTSGGGLWELTTAGSGANINAIEAKQIEASKYSNAFSDGSTPAFDSGYPWIVDRGIASNASVSVDILMLRIPCQYGKMEIDALFNTTTQPTPNASGGGGSGTSPSSPTISSVSRIARDANNDTVRISASSGSNNSGTITYGVNTSNTAPTSFVSGTDFTQPRNSTRYYFAKQGGTASSGTQYDAAAVDTTPSAFTFTTKNSATAGQSFSQASSAIAGLADGDSASVSVSGGTVNVSSVVNGGTVTATGTAAAAGGQTVVTVTIGGVQGTFTINTTAPSDNSPDAFGDFTAVTGSQLSTVNTSNSKQITGIDVATAVSISGNGSFSIAGGGYTTSANITNNQSITVRLTSSGSYNTGVSTTLNVGGVTGIYSVTTRAQAQATAPTFPTVALQTNTSSSSQVVSAAAVVQSGNTLQIKVGSGGSWANATSTFSSAFSQNRNSSVTYYFRAVSTDGDISSEVSASLYIPPIHGVQSIANISFANGSHDNTYSVTSSLNGAAAALYTSKSFSITESASWITATIANSTTGTMRLQISANTGIARSANVTYTISSTNGGPNVSASFTVSQAAVTPTVNAIWEVNIAQGAYNPSASFNQQGYNPFTGGGYGSFSNTTNTVASINSGGGNWYFADVESSNANTIFLIFTSSAANSGWTTLKVYNGTNTSGTLLGTFTRTSLTYTGTGGTAAWDLGSDVTTSTGNRFLQFS